MNEFKKQKIKQFVAVIAFCLILGILFLFLINYFFLDF